jgi:hypothetical protein
MTEQLMAEGVEFVDVDGLKIRFRRNKVEGKIPTVLTSPWPESLYAFQRIWPILSAETSLIAFDLPGYGQSEGRPSLMSPRAMGDFIPRILTSLGLAPRTCGGTRCRNLRATLCDQGPPRLIREPGYWRWRHRCSAHGGSLEGIHHCPVNPLFRRHQRRSVCRRCPRSVDENQTGSASTERLSGIFGGSPSH